MDTISAKNKLTIDNYKQKKRTVTRIKWPDTDKDVGLMLLNCAELQESYFAARDYFAKKGYQNQAENDMEYEAEKLTQQICRFLIDPESCTGEEKYRIFASADECRKSLTANERLFFATKYLELLG